jgi:hypothetical protein
VSFDPVVLLDIDTLREYMGCGNSYDAQLELLLRYIHEMEARSRTMRTTLMAVLRETRSDRGCTLSTELDCRVGAAIFPE